MKNITFDKIINPPKVNCNRCKFGHTLGDFNYQWCNFKVQKTGSINPYTSMIDTGNIVTDLHLNNNAFLKNERNKDGHCICYKERRDIGYMIRKFFKILFQSKRRRK